MNTDSFATVRDFMDKNNIKYLLVNSTNMFLLEYNTPEENSRYKLTNFSGSVGEALVTPETIYLFVDGRYHIQADNEVDLNKISVVKLQTGDKFVNELVKRIPENEILGVFSKKISVKKFESISKLHSRIKTFDNDPLDRKHTNAANTENIDILPELSGKTTGEKIQKLVSDLKLKEDELVYITDLDEVSYLCNKRNYTTPFSAKIRARMLISKDKFLIFYPDEFEKLENILSETTSKIYYDSSSTNLYDKNIIEKKGIELAKNPVKIMKSMKNKAELESLKKAFEKTDKAVSAIRDYIQNNNNLSEADITEQLKKEFKKQGAVGLSFNPIVAKDQNSALAHYSKSSDKEIVADGSLVLIDCGAYFEGGLATDITRVFVKDTPSELHKKIYTIVLKAFLMAYNYPQTHPNEILTGYNIDKSVREFFDGLELNGFVFNHGLGHGIGINVHEYPPNLSSNEIAKTEIKDGMCFSIEPGLYKQGIFGIRLENSCYFEDGKIHSFVKMNYEKKLINYDMLTEQEKLWLDEFEVK